ncbi:hypothetical protein EMCRGX_G010421 [Ephydatia muelleri]
MVLFDDGSSSTIPVTRIVEAGIPASRILKVGKTVGLRCSGQTKQYTKPLFKLKVRNCKTRTGYITFVRLVYIGNQKDMEELIDALQGEEGSADEEDHETDEEIQKDDELVNGCCTPSSTGYKLLDQTIIGGIRMHINYKFSASSLDGEKIRWKSILQGNMNAKCRSLRSRSPKFVKVQPTVFDATHDDGGCRAGL